MTEAERKWEAAKRSWDSDDGTNTVRTINAGEDLYFAALNLIAELHQELRLAKIAREAGQ